MSIGRAALREAQTGSVGIGLGRYIVGERTPEEWVIYGLGSCIGLILCDSQRQVAGMAHVVLPASPPGVPKDPAKYADTAVSLLVREMEILGALRRRLHAQIAGGARMLQVGHAGDIGARNAVAIREALAAHKIPIVAECVGGNFGRTLRWDLRRGVAVISRVGHPDQVLTPEVYRFVRLHTKSAV